MPPAAAKARGSPASSARTRRLSRARASARQASFGFGKGYKGKSKGKGKSYNIAHIAMSDDWDESAYFAEDIEEPYADPAHWSLVSG